MSKTYSVQFTRIEINWLYRQLLNGKKNAEGRIKTFDAIMESDRVTNPPKTPEEYNRFRCLSEEQVAEYKMAITHRDELFALTNTIHDRMVQGDKERLGLVNLRADLTEAMGLVEEDSARLEAEKRLMDLPEEEKYNISFDRATLKFTLKLIENDLHKFRTQVIPAYEKAPVEDFKDPIQTKSYWLNKARQSKTILETLKTKLEKNL